MFRSHKNNININNVHERCLRLIYSDKRSSIGELLEKDRSVFIHYRNFKVLAIETHKVKNCLSAKIFSDLFCQTEMDSYNLTIQHDFEVPFLRAVYRGSECITYLAPKTWNILPASIMEGSSLTSITKLIKKWAPQTCHCRLCKSYIPGIGFVENLL